MIGLLLLKAAVHVLGILSRFIIPKSEFKSLVSYGEVNELMNKSRLHKS
jgi:hypothetical protein